MSGPGIDRRLLGMTGRGRIRQVAAFIVLLVRHFRRSGMAGSRIERFRKGSAFVIRVAMLLFYASIGRTFGTMSLRGAPSGMPSVEWFLVSVLGFSACWGALARTPALRGMALPLASPFIEALPVDDAARTFVELFEVGVVHVVVCVAFVTAAPALAASVALGLGLSMSLTAAACGAALGRWAFVLLPPRRAASLSQVLVGAQVLFMAIAFTSSRLPQWLSPPAIIAPLALPIAEGRGIGTAFCMCAAMFAAAMGLRSLAERLGYDRLEVGPAAQVARASEVTLSLGSVDEVLARREPGGRRWPMVLFGTVALAALAALIFVDDTHPLGKELWSVFARSYALWVTWMALPMAAVIANRAVTRDLHARPFLAALPIEPRALLAGKVAVVRRRLFIGLLPIGFALLSPLPKDVLLELGWRGAVVSCAAFIYGSAAVSVAFLVGGIQNARPQPGGTLRLESLLLLLPFGALLAVPSPWMAVVPLGALALIDLEARRAATRVVRWLDDGEDFERETPQWRAALAFGAFLGVQLIVAQVVRLSTDDQAVVAGTSYIVSALALALLTLQGRRDLAPLVLWPKNPLAIVAGLVGGVATAAFAHLYAHHLLPLHYRQGPPSAADAAGAVLLAVTTFAFAPVVEELFFRAWLQHVVERDLNDGRRWMAPIIVAFAFASAHPPLSFPAVFPVGLVAGALYFRTAALVPCIAAHCAHNVLVTLFP